MPVTTEATMTESLDSFVIKAIKERVKERAEEYFESEKKKMIDELDRQKNEIVASTVLHIMRYVDYSTLGNTLTIRVLSELPKEKTP